MSDRLGSPTFSDVGMRRKMVGDDMRAIFGGEAAATWRARGPSPAGAAAAAPTAKRPLRRYMLPVLAGAVAAGAIGGLLVVTPLHHDQRTRASTSQRVQPARTAPSATGAPTAMIARIEPQQAPAVIEPRIGVAAAAPSPSAPARPMFQPQVARSQPAAEDACESLEGYAYARCRRADVLSADRSLRAAYDRAIDAGVDRARLVSVRNRWAALRAAEYDRPDVLLDGYARLEDRLDRAAYDADDELR